MTAHDDHAARNPWWTLISPLVALASLAAIFIGHLQPSTLAAEVFLIVVLCATVFAAVHHAELVAARVGEPFGSIILAVAVTVIEVGLIVALMLSSPDGGPSIARDTVYAAVMLVLTGVIGACLLAGGQKHFEQSIRITGTTSALAVLGALATFALILPNFTTSSPGPAYDRTQLAGVAVVSLLLYAAFLFVQTVRHRDYFLAVDGGDDAHVRPGNAVTAVSSIWLIMALVGVVLLAKSLSPQLKSAIAAAHLPYDFAGVVIAALVLLPESIAAVKAALANRPQTSINLALGSALASIGLTIPAVTAFTVIYDGQLQLGVSPGKTVLLVLALFISGITLTTGRTNVLQGIVHLAIFAIFMLLSVVP